MSTHQKLFGLAMWDTWQNKVKASLPNFAAHPIYVDQSQSEAEYQSVADYVFEKTKGLLDPDGMLRDAEFGARVVETTHGKLTRMWLDTCVEVEFLSRHLDALDAGDRILDIGAGYGRIAATIGQEANRYVCVDPVPISTQVCRAYCARFAPKVEVPSLPDFLALLNRGNEYVFDLAINVHSWNECTREQISAWLDVIDELKVPYLFTVSHGDNAGKIEGSYYAWEPGRPSFRPLIEARYELITEESIGFSLHPHALWRRRK